ncbi:MAG: hypothetical protein EA428_08725 [Spirochaetaceae bacterium]|nr:MAG: hypothetical protein EA428_08725 [Spirochaetaceae bacterium]
MRVEISRLLRTVYTLGALAVLLSACATAPAPSGLHAPSGLQELSGLSEPPPELERFTGVYAARVAEGLQSERRLLLILRPNATLQLQTEYLYDRQTITEYGEWEVRDADTAEAVIHVAVLGRTDGAYETPVYITLVPEAEETTLRALTYNEQRYGTEGLLFEWIGYR